MTDRSKTSGEILLSEIDEGGRPDEVSAFFDDVSNIVTVQKGDAWYTLFQVLSKDALRDDGVEIAMGQGAWRARIAQLVSKTQGDHNWRWKLGALRSDQPSNSLQGAVQEGVCQFGPSLRERYILKVFERAQNNLLLKRMMRRSPQKPSDSQ